MISVSSPRRSRRSPRRAPSLAEFAPWQPKLRAWLSWIECAVLVQDDVAVLGVVDAPRCRSRSCPGPGRVERVVDLERVGDHLLAAVVDAVVVPAAEPEAVDVGLGASRCGSRPSAPRSGRRRGSRDPSRVGLAGLQRLRWGPYRASAQRPLRQCWPPLIRGSLTARRRLRERGRVVVVVVGASAPRGSRSAPARPAGWGCRASPARSCSRGAGCAFGGPGPSGRRPGPRGRRAAAPRGAPPARPGSPPSPGSIARLAERRPRSLFTPAARGPSRSPVPGDPRRRGGGCTLGFGVVDDRLRAAPPRGSLTHRRLAAEDAGSRRPAAGSDGASRRPAAGPCRLRSARPPARPPPSAAP